MAIASKAARKLFAEATVAAMPTAVVVDRDGRVISNEFGVSVDESGDVTNVDDVTLSGSDPAAIRLLGGDGSWQEIDLPLGWI